MKKNIFVLVMLLMAIGSASAQRLISPNKMYIFGVTFAAQDDSVVYMTDVQKLEDSHIYRNNNFLYCRSEYASQFHDYIMITGLNHPTALVMYNQNRTKLEKKYLKMKSKYEKKGVVVKFVPETDFMFREISLEEGEQSTQEAQKQVEKQGPADGKGPKDGPGKGQRPEGMPPGGGMPGGGMGGH